MTAWKVIDNVTGDSVSDDFDTRDKAGQLCAALNVDAGPGGRYGVRVVRTSDDLRDELTELVGKAREAARGDSNDGEIEALQWALDEALDQLGRQDLRQ